MPVAARAVAFVTRVTRRLSGVGLARTVAALAFTTVLGIVPLVVVAFVYVARYPLFERWVASLEGFLLAHLLPGTASTVRPYLEGFTARASDLQGLGIGFVVVTAVLLIATVEREINAIFRVREPRSLARRALVYGLSVPIAVLAIGAAVHTTRWLIERSLEAAPYAGGALALVELPVAIGLATLVFSALYLILPARRVPLRAALAGGLFAALAFEAGKRGFMLYATHAPGYRRVYGALAVVPLFLVWIYVSWVIVLVGAAVAATLAEGPVRSSRRGT
jgi:membrane protein